MAHISTGDMLRERVASGDELGKAVSGIMQSGALVPDKMVNKLVEDRIEQAGLRDRVYFGRVSADGEPGEAAGGVVGSQADPGGGGSS